MNEVLQLLSLKDNKTIIYQLQQLIAGIAKTRFNCEIDKYSIDVSSAQEERFGNYTTNVSLKFAKEIGKTPKEIADIIASDLKDKYIEKAEVAGPGFINIFLNRNYFLDSLSSLLIEQESYGKWDLSNEQVMVEFGQPNTHKAFHVGHLKSAITGLSIVRLLKNLGHEVIQANFFGDVGMHVSKCVWGYTQKSKDEAFRQEIENETDPHKRMKLLDSCYVYGAKMFKENTDSEAEIREINKKIYSKEDEGINTIYILTKAWSLEHLNSLFTKLGVVYDRQYPESEVYPIGVETVREHLGSIFEEDNGAIIFPGEKYGVNTWVFLTNEGNPTYSAKDYGLAFKKLEEYPDTSLSIYTTSVEQVAYFKGVFKALEMTDNRFGGRLLHVPFGWMLREDKKKFSSRMGETVKGMDIIEEAKSFSLLRVSENKEYSASELEKISETVAISGLKFLILSHEIHKDISYNPEQFLNPEGFSGPYVLYGYVRAKSILRQSALGNRQIELSLKEELDPSVQQEINEEDLSATRSTYDYIPNESELRLLKLLSQYPQVTLEAGRNLSPHRICYFLFELTQCFNQFYKENKVLIEDKEVERFRLDLTEGVSIVLKNGLDLLGIETVEQM